MMQSEKCNKSGIHPRQRHIFIRSPGNNFWERQSCAQGPGLRGESRRNRETMFQVLAEVNDLGFHSHFLPARSRIGILCASPRNEIRVTFLPVSFVFLTEILSRPLSSQRRQTCWQMLCIDKTQEVLEGKVELPQTRETEIMLAPVEWQLGSMCSVKNFCLIFWVLLPPYALLFSPAVTSDVKISPSLCPPKNVL